MSNTGPIDASNHPDDRFGYSVYAGVLFADSRMTAAVDAVRSRIPQPRASLAAHVTVMGTFCDIPSLDQVIALAAGVASQHSPLDIAYSPDGLKVHETWAGFDGPLTPALRRMEQDFHAALKPLVTDAYGYALAGYSPHLTVWQECPATALRLAESLGRAIDIRQGFTASEVSLVARRGPAYGGRWETVRSFKLGR
jgi:2'-5' RNA ligase